VRDAHKEEEYHLNQGERHCRRCRRSATKGGRGGRPLPLLLLRMLID
jgi:hypothetical protein